jgi:hypothetical protein
MIELWKPATSLTTTSKSRFGWPALKRELKLSRGGVPVFYRDIRLNLDIMEHPGGRRYEIRFLRGVPGDQNYEVLRELDETAA